MATPSNQQQSTDPVTMLTAIVTDLESRLRRVERILYCAVGALSGGGGTWWLTGMMTRR